MKVIVTTLAAAALAATALVAVPATAAPAPAADITVQAVAKKSFSYYAKFTSRQVVDYGNPQGMGDLTITQGTVTDMTGKKVGTLTAVVRVVAPSPKKDAELRDTQSQIQLKDGQIFAQAVNEDPKGKPPVDLHVMSVTGGTGAYASARGTLLMRKVGDKYLMAYDIFVSKDLKSQTFTFDNLVDSAAEGDAPQGIGDVTLTRATGANDSYVRIATRAGDARGIVTNAIDMQVFTATGSLFARTIARTKGGAAQATTFAVLGGTGSLAGYRGELTLTSNGRSMTAKLAAPGGKAKPLTWFEDGGRKVTEVSIPGGSFLGAEGYMFKTANVKAKKTGDYFATLLTYEEIDGVVPVVGMIEQEFATGTMIITGITLATAGAPAERPIVGGTGDLGGAAGQAVSLEQSSGVWRKTARFWR